MNNKEIRKAAYKLYWSHSTDVSEYDEKDAKEILEDLAVITRIEDSANETVKSWLNERRSDGWRYRYGV